MAGLTVTKEQVNELAGVIARTLKLSFERIAVFKKWLDSKTAGDLTGLGLTAAEIADLRSAFTDLEQLRTVWEGTATVTSAKDFTTFAKRLWGIGVTTTNTVG